MPANESNYEALLEACDQDLKAGQGKKAAARLEQLNLSQVPRKWRQLLARTCRRAGLVSLGLKLLTPLAHSKKLSEAKPTPEELVEYAALLNLNGSTQGALDLLSLPQVAHLPESHLFRAFCCFSRWDSSEAIGHLQKYLESDLEDYARLIGRVNLASAFVAVRHPDSGFLLDELISFLKEKKLSRLHANCLELRAQVYIHEANYPQAEACLQLAGELLGQDSTFDRLFVQKWLSISEALSTRNTESLKKYRNEALAHQEWEGVREADLYLQKIEFDPVGFEHLYFGSPNKGYRERIRNLLHRTPEQDSFRFGPAEAPCLDVMTGEIHQWNAKIAAGKKNHQVIEILLRDLYRPISMGALFEELFPGEHFDIFSSTTRVHQTITRTRKWIAKNNLPIEIIESHGKYNLKTTAPFAFQLPLERQRVDWHQTQMERLAKIYEPGAEIKASEACHRLDLSHSSFLRLMRWGVEKNQIQKIGRGSYTTYTLRFGRRDPD